MKMFTIENDTNNITVHATAKQAQAVPDAERFSSEAGLAKLAAHWPAGRLVEIWNSLPGARPVHKFADANKAVNRIWRVLQSLGSPEAVRTQSEAASQSDVTVATVAPPTRPVALAKPSSKPTASNKKKAPQLAPQAKVARAGSKTGKILNKGAPRRGVPFILLPAFP